MAGESEMAEWDKLQGLGLDENVRDEVMRGCELTQQLQTILNCARGSDLRHLTADFSAEIVSTFSTALRLLSSANSVGWRGDSQSFGGRQIGEVGMEGCGRSPRAVPSAKFSPINSPRPGARSQASGRALSDKIFKCNNKLAQSSERLQSKKYIPVKNLLPKLRTRISGYSCEPGNDVPPKDGYSWRKYGQKEILGAQHPRSYYRCTRRNNTGCQATKQVQRAEDDPSVFEITYRGCHSCEIEPRLLEIQLPSPIPQIGSRRDAVVPNSLLLGTDCDLLCETSGIDGLTATQFNCSSEQASSSLWFGIDASSGCKVENEDLGDFAKNLAPSPFSYTFDFLNNPCHEGNSTSNTMQLNTSNRPGEMYIPSPFRNQGGDGEHLNGCAAICEGELGMPDFAGFFGSHEASDPNAIPLVPATPLMGSMERANSYGHLQASESDITEVVSGHTPVDVSPMPDMDLMFQQSDYRSPFTI